MPRRPVVATLLVTLLAVVLVPLPSAADDAGLALLRVTYTDSKVGVHEPFTLVDADDPERIVGSGSTNPSGVAFIIARAGRAKMQITEGLWYGGISHATATVITLAPGEEREMTVSQPDSSSVNIEVEDTRGDSLPFVRVNVRSAADPAQILATGTTRNGEIWLPHNSVDRIVEVVDLTGVHATNTSSWGGGDVVMERADGTTLPPLPSVKGLKLGQVQGKLKIFDFNFSELRSRLYRADEMGFELDIEGVYKPDYEKDPNIRYRDLPAGEYKIRLSDGLWVGGDSHSTATTVTVTPNRTTRVTGRIPLRGEIRGIVRSDRGVELNDVLATLYRVGSDEPVVWKHTGRTHLQTRTGFVFEGLPPGDYQVRLSDSPDRIVPRWIGGGTSRDTAKVFTVKAKQEMNLGVVTVKTALRATTSPRITGTSTSGSTLTASANQWSLPDVAVTRQWLRDGRPLTGATGATYRVTTADRGHRLSVRVTGTKAGLPVARATSGTVVVP